MNDKSLFEEILERADIVTVISSYIDVIKKGKSYVAICPFHNDSNPSMMISRDKKIFKCFVCGTSGNAITFVKQYEKISTFEACKRVAEIIGYDDPRLHSNEFVKKVDADIEPIIKCINDINEYYQYTLASSLGDEAREYLINRGINEDFQNKFGLGFSPIDGTNTIKYLQAKGHSLKTIEGTGITLINTNSKDNNAGRVIFPICDEDGQVVGFSARKLPNDPSEAKYVNSPGTKLFHKSEILYNYHNAKQTCKLSKYIYLLEGFMDVFALEKINITSSIALMGTELSSSHLTMLKKLNVEVRLCLDGDIPGQKATMKAVASLRNKKIPVRIVDNRNNPRDPDEILKDEGPDGLNKYLNNLIDPFEFIINFYTNTAKLESSEQKEKFIMNIVDSYIIALEPRTFEYENAITKLSKITGYDEKVINNYVKNRRNKTKNNDDNEVDMSLFKRNRPQKHTKELRRLLNCEKEILYHMFNNKDAISFYSRNIESFYDELYNMVANFIVAMHQRTGNIDLSVLLSDVENQIEDEKRKKEVTNLIFDINNESGHPPYSDKLMEDCKNIITDEKIKAYEKDMLETSVLGKSETEKARIYDDFNRRKEFEKKNK